jgi:hypothetical protein
LTKEQHKQVLESHVFIVKKRCVKVKACKVAGGNKQRGYIAKEDASSPMCATESVLLTCSIDARENRETATINISNTFIQTVVEYEKDKVIILIMVVDMICKIAPDFYQVLECSLWNHGGEFAVLSEVHQQLEEQELHHEHIQSMCLEQDG